jgi:G3E family GTPase
MTARQPNEHSRVRNSAPARRCAIDNDLIVESDEEIYEMNNGCICCTVHGDLIGVPAGLQRHRMALVRTHVQGASDGALILEAPSP